MISLWWLCLIIPVSACFGFLVACLLMIGKLSDETDEKY